MEMSNSAPSFIYNVSVDILFFFEGEQLFRTLPCGYHHRQIQVADIHSYLYQIPSFGEIEATEGLCLDVGLI